MADCSTVLIGATGLSLDGFLSGLWTPPALVGGPLATIINYSPSGAAAQVLLDSPFNSAPLYTAIGTMVVYGLVFAFIAIRYFRWE